MKLVSAATYGAISVVVTQLEMTDPGRVVAVDPPPGAELVVVADPRPDLSADYYRRVGGDWYWVDRLEWSPEQWQAWVDRPEHHLLQCVVDGQVWGYAELEQQPGGHVEIAYFGLLPEGVGRGLGRWWLSAVLRHAWSLPGSTRVWVHTCDLDAPAALPNYLRSGLLECGRDIEWRLPG